ncbi:MAG: MBL fold metallo-hydrolase [Candidatus Gastranaerophilaceae bacterium]|nr:MBL fold metallo-hydrolase [Candidatus Gastranaerophilaceae bacterium]
MNITTYIAGPIDANNYLIYDESTRDAVLIDCSDYREDILNEVKQKGLNVKYILLTHGHFDHILGVNEMKKALNVKAGIAKADIILLEHTPEMCEMFGIPPEEPQIADFTFDSDTKLSIGNNQIQILYTPGHTEGGVSYLIEDNLFCGDTLFKGSFGRTDLPGGDFKAIVNSIKNTLFKLDDNINVYPGHGESTTIGYEKKYNEIN